MQRFHTTTQGVQTTKQRSIGSQHAVPWSKIRSQNVCELVSAFSQCFTSKDTISPPMWHVVVALC
eukprot:4255120-Amphidinium_carterae.1